jgi:uncharacterized membrane protein YhaH (DUF805 family)
MNAFQEYFINVFRYKYFQPQGRARRKEFWMFTLFSCIVSIILNLIPLYTAEGISILGSVYALAALLPVLCLNIRRLHDTGRRGWWIFLNVIPLIGGIIYIVFLCLDSQPGQNKYGPNPKGA